VGGSAGRTGRHHRECVSLTEHIAAETWPTTARPGFFGVPNERWDNDVFHDLHQVKGSDFEAGDTSSLKVNLNSGQVRRSDLDE
jgi:hypothetical protein